MRSMRNVLWLSLAVVMLLGVSVQADFLVPTGITMTGGTTTGNYKIDNLSNNPLLVDSGVLATGISGNYGKNTCARGSFSAGVCYITFDFGTDVVLGDVVIWGYDPYNNQGSKTLKDFTVEFSSDGSVWGNSTGAFLMTQPVLVDGQYAGEVFDFADTAARYARLVVTSVFAGTVVGADEIKFNDLLTPKDTVVAFDPADGAIDVDSTTDLTWVIGDPNGATLVDVYFGTDPNVLSIVADDLDIATTTVLSDDLPALTNYETYYWKVNLVGVYEPNEPFSFTTGFPDPLIVASPESLTVAVGQPAEFAASVLNADTYVWYKESDPATALVTGGNIVVDGDVLTITNVSQGDEDWYYCVASHSAKGVEISTDSARLLTERIVAHWSFDDTLDSDEGHVGTIIGSGNAVTFDADAQAGATSIKFASGEKVEIADVSDFDFYPEGLTVNVWVKTTTSGWHAFIAKQDGNSGFDFKHSGANVTGNMRPSLSGNSGNVGVNDGEWHMVTYTYDPDVTTFTLHVDGVWRSTDTTGTPLLNEASLIFGGRNTTGEQFTGQLDELTFYSYAQTPLEIAQNYADITGETVCYMNQPYDYTNDCMVGLEDFAMFALQWLENKIVTPSN